jgi:chaperonin GroEL
VPGGGVALLRCKDAVEKARGAARGDEKIGVDIVLRSLAMPIRQIADNCGVDGSVIADEVAEKPTTTGYDANSGKYVDMFKAGIIDPLKVVRTALQNAASISGLMLTTETLVTDLNKEDKKKRLVEGSVR